ncbi:MAG TPA: hypothetical protein VH394_31375 [Thermoanaerobaculia bacterium]|nr:hypothetical protein [Thermoanaerobaculia bacterium]
MEKETPEKAEPQRDEVLVLLKLLDQEILADDRSKRRLERDLNMGQGYIASIIKGRIMLKVQHVWDFADAIGFEPLVLFFNAAPKKHQKRFLSEMKLIPGDLDHPISVLRFVPPEKLDEMVRLCVRQELVRMIVLGWHADSERNAAAASLGEKVPDETGESAGGQDPQHSEPEPEEHQEGASGQDVE